MFRFDRYDRQMKTFRDMTARLGIDPADFARDCLGYRLTSAIRRCSVCHSGDACRAWLAGTQTAGHAPAFCPNRSVFAEARRTPPGAPRAAEAAWPLLPSPGRSSR